MKKHLSRGVKSVIEDFPAVGKILDEFSVGCTTCFVGTCLLQDVVSIHNLSPNDEAELMYRIEKAIYPKRDVQRVGVTEKPEEATPFIVSQPIQALVDEHVVIKRWLALIPDVIKALDAEPDTAWLWVAEGVELIKNYADRYHHAKEEDVLFKYVDESSEIIQAMYEEHRAGRSHRQAISAAIETGDKDSAAEHLLAFRELLTGHIRKEDDILYPWIDRGLTPTQVRELQTAFADIDAASVDDPQRYVDFINHLEARLRLQDSLACYGGSET